MEELPTTTEQAPATPWGFCSECDAPWYSKRQWFCDNCDARLPGNPWYGRPTVAQDELGVVTATVRQGDPPRVTWDELWVRVADVVALRSTCPRKRVGAVLVSPDNRVLSTGYNGAPTGVAHCLDVGCDADAEGNCTRSAHAELNAILGCTTKPTWCIMYVTHFPCPQCALAMVQAGVVRLVCPPGPDTERYDLARRLLTRSGVVIDEKE